uniref:RGS domain-containing protein n=1 Tax=Romanomermis culicivorax TaxID=13658 RepID=A0A915K9M0_ROMCU
MADQPCSSYKCEDGSTSPCYSDRSTPPYLQWARDLNSLLKDPNGYAVFEKFLIHELGHANELMFFYACEGMKIAYQDSQKSIKETTNDADKKIKESQWAQYMKHFYHEYIVHNSRIAMPCIRSEVRLEVHNLIGKVDRHLDLVILVQKEVEEVLRTRHALFVESDEYISYIQAKEGHIVAENPNSQVGGMTGIATAGDAMATSTASMDEARPPSRLLSTVLEESEIDSLPDNEPQITHYHTLPGRLSSAAASTSVDSPYNFKDKSDPRSQVASQISLDSAPKLTQSLLKKTYQNRIQNTNGFLSR